MFCSKIIIGKVDLKRCENEESGARHKSFTAREHQNRFEWAQIFGFWFWNTGDILFEYNNW